MNYKKASDEISFTPEPNQDLLEQYKLLTEMDKRYDIQHEMGSDASRDIQALRQKDGSQSMFQAASFLEKQLIKVKIPVLNMRYENMDVRSYKKNANVVDFGEARFAVDVIDIDGNKRAFTVPVEIRNGDLIEPEHFLDSIGRKYAFTHEGLTDYITSTEIEDEDSVTKKEESVGRTPGEEQTLASSDKDMKKEGVNNIQLSEEEELRIIDEALNLYLSASVELLQYKDGNGLHMEIYYDLSDGSVGITSVMTSSTSLNPTLDIIPLLSVPWSDAPYNELLDEDEFFEIRELDLTLDEYAEKKGIDLDDRYSEYINFYFENSKQDLIREIVESLSPSEEMALAKNDNKDMKKEAQYELIHEEEIGE